MEGASPRAVISYRVHSWSSYSADFLPDRITENKPSDPKSRWLSEGNKLSQYLLLRLDQPAVVQSITFGKFEKSHACNLKRFQVLGGMDSSHLNLLCEGGLKNSSEPETFPLTYEVGGKPFPCCYIKIVPLQSWGHSFNFSIWFVELRGVVEEGRVREAEAWFEEYRERQAVRLCLKHLRQHDYPEAFEALQKKARVQLEHPLLTQLHSLLVEKGDFEAGERVMAEAAAGGHLDQHIAQQPVEAKWTAFEPKAKVGVGAHAVTPGMRGGHQMCVDPVAEVLYMYGGWDGSHDLGDFWKFDIGRSQWACLCQDTSLVGGPTPRSCHKMCLDVEGHSLYLLGRYLDPATRADIAQASGSALIPSDFYRYCIDTDTWDLLSSDTYSDGGPQLVYDHQMCFDPTSQTLYVFGGRVLTIDYISEQSQCCYSGLYAYHCNDRQWIGLRPDYSGSNYIYDLKPRMAHTMLFHPGRHQLIVMGGQRDKQPLSDMLVYNVLSDETTVVADGKDSHIPASGFTMRTTIDPHTNEIYLLTGLNKFEEPSDRRDNRQHTSNSLWLCDMDSYKWSCIFQSPQAVWHHTHSSLPAPRYAHQFIYDHVHKMHYMFGGNPGDSSGKSQQNMRLDDFWKLKLVRHSKERLLRLCQFAIRKQRFDELALEDPVKALSYLQTSVAAIVNHDDQEESAEFRQLTSTLFTSPAPSTQDHGKEADGGPPSLTEADDGPPSSLAEADDGPPSLTEADDGPPSLTETDDGPSSLTEAEALKHRQRNKLYDSLCSYWPDHMTQPRDNITDLIKLT